MNASERNSDIAVIGGGLIGKTTALACAQIGLRVALLARAATQAPGARVYALSASTQRLFERLCIWQALDTARLSPVYDMRIYGDDRAELHFSAFQAAAPQLAWIVEASLLENALDAALRFQSNLSWIDACPHSLSILRDTAALELNHAPPLKAQLVIGADGAHSWVRAQIGAQLKRRDYRQTGIVANFKIGQPHRETAYQWFRDGEVIALLPLPDDHVSLVWSAHAQHAQALLALDTVQFTAAVEQMVDGKLGALACISSVQSFPLARQTVDRLVAPRVALIGDAAHLVHPLAGQGMNLGLRDAATLADILAAREPYRDCGDWVLLRRYARARREDIQKLIAMTDGLHRLFSAPGALARNVRKAGLALLDRQPLIKRWLVGQALG